MVNEAPDWSHALVLLDGPYVSDFLRETVRAHNLPVVRTEADIDLTNLGTGTLSEEQACARLAFATPPLVLTNSENALAWLVKNAGQTKLPTWIEIFKNKARTRDLLLPMYPDFRYQEIPATELSTWEPTNIPYPFVIKPAIGFFSLGVHLITDRDHWQEVRQSLAADLAGAAAVYPQEVMDPTVFLAEECIVGDEYAIDAYFDADGKAVITNILVHKFSSAADVGDRVYSTSTEIISEWLHPFTAWLNEVGTLANVRNFPMHVEVRVQRDGEIVPIEINPLRFGGWCTTADLTLHSWGFNPYLAFLRGEKPDWPTICRDRDGLVWSIIVLDNTTGVSGEDIGAFDFEALQRCFHRVLDCRPVDFRKFPLFGFLFVETEVAETAELDAILVSDLRTYVIGGPGE